MNEMTNMVESAQTTLNVLNAQRAWQIRSPYGTDDRPEAVLADAIAAYRKRFKIPETMELMGTATPWKDGAPAGKPVSIKVALASAAEIAARSSGQEPVAVTSGQ